MEAQVHFHGELRLFRRRMSDEGSHGAVKTENLIYDFSLLDKKIQNKEGGGNSGI